jgi:hemerythrin
MKLRHILSLILAASSFAAWCQPANPFLGKWKVTREGGNHEREATRLRFDLDQPSSPVTCPQCTDQLFRTKADGIMQWKAEYAIGIQEIDSQHKTLIEFITEFEDAVAGKVHWNAVHPLIVRAREFVKFHFAVEESLMQIVNYPQLIPHRAEHRYVLKQFEFLEQRVLRQQFNAELLPLISSWLLHHMTESDKPFGQYALNNARPVTAV